MRGTPTASPGPAEYRILRRRPIDVIDLRPGRTAERLPEGEEQDVLTSPVPGTVPSRRACTTLLPTRADAVARR